MGCLGRHNNAISPPQHVLEGRAGTDEELKFNALAATLGAIWYCGAWISRA